MSTLNDLLVAVTPPQQTVEEVGGVREKVFKKRWVTEGDVREGGIRIGKGNIFVSL